MQMDKHDFLDEHGLSNEGSNPFQSLEEEALFVSGMTRERAFAIDSMSIGKNVDDLAFNRLIEALFARLLADKDETFRQMFTINTEMQMVNLADYLTMRTGGSPHYSVSQGVPNLGKVHQHLPISERYIEKWLKHMEEALYDCRVDFKDEFHAPLLDYLRLQGYFLLVYRNRREEYMKRATLF